MALTKVGPAGIGSTPGTGYTIGDSFLHSTGLDATNAYYTGIVTSQNIRVLGDLQVDGTTTTLDTVVTSVDRLEVAANNTTVGVAITQSGTGDILNLYDGSTEVFTVVDGGHIGVGKVPGDSNSFTKALDVNGPSGSAVYVRTAASNTNFGLMGHYGTTFYLRNQANGRMQLDTNGTERMRITGAGNVGIALTNPNRKLVISQANSTAYSGTDFDQDYHVLKLNNFTDSKTVGMQFLIGSNGEAAITATETSDGATDLIFGTRGSGSRAERLRITSEGHKWTHGGSIFHGSGDYSDFTDAQRNSYHNVSIRAGNPNAGTTPTNDKSAIKIYPAGTRNNAVGTLTGGIAWQHLDINNGDWGTRFGDGAQIWMGAAIHDVPGQERDRFNLWMNDQISEGSNPNNLAIEAYPNGIVRHPKVPSFLAKGGTALSNSSNIIIVSANTEFNNGSHYSTSNGRFTAPVDGIYYFSFWGLLYPMSSAVVNIYYSKNGNQYGHLIQGGADSNSHTSRAGSIMMSMSAGDYAELRINRNNYSGINAYSSQWNMCGFLVG